MANKLDKIIVIDVEATCWKDKIPLGYVNEIIEVGIVVLNLGTMETSEFSYLIQPKYSKISEFCTELTGIKQEDVSSLGFFFSDFCDKVKKDIPHLKDYTWASYGDYDRRQFEKDCQLWNIPYIFGRTHLNIKNFFALKKLHPREVGMSKALNILGLKLKGKHHKALDDARNITRILKEIL